MLFISNTTIDLLDNKGSILKTVFTDTNVNTSVNVQIDTNDKQGHFYIKITGFGRYNFASNNNVTVLFINIENFIPISVNTSSVTSSTMTPVINEANSNNIGLTLSSFVSVLMI